MRSCYVNGEMMASYDRAISLKISCKDIVNRIGICNEGMRKCRLDTYVFNDGVHDEKRTKLMNVTRNHVVVLVIKIILVIWYQVLLFVLIAMIKKLATEMKVVRN